MRDRELLELAAKAATLKIEWSEPCQRYEMFNDLRYAGSWNPLDDDGDALRLAVQLDLLIYSYSAEQKCVAKWSGSGMSVEYWHWNSNQGQAPAMRRAIVRAAAEIGKATP